MREMKFLEDTGVLITNTRAVLGDKTYALANITSVSKKIVPVNYSPVLLMLIVGVLLGSCGLQSGSQFNAGVGWLGLVIIVAGIALVVITSRPKYAVTIGSSSGEQHALIDNDPERIQRIVDAINNAIIARG